MCTYQRLQCMYCNFCVDPDAPYADQLMRTHVDAHGHDCEKPWQDCDLKWTDLCGD